VNLGGLSARAGGLVSPLIFCYYMSVRVFKYTGFSRFASKEGITDHELLEVVDQLEGDQADANLGGNVYKVRVARQGEGKSSGYRVIVYFRNEFRTFFSYGFSKSDRGNISEKELKAFKLDAKKRLSFTDEQIEVRLQDGSLIEIIEEV
jgi:hypothetical protein